MKLGISQKLFILFFLFILIFYGTVFDLLMTVRQMSGTSARIVDVHYRISGLSDNLKDNLMEMDINEKKLRLLKKNLYFEGYEAARQAYIRDLNLILGLGTDRFPVPRIWHDLKATYDPYTLFRSQDKFAETGWGERAVADLWLLEIQTARQQNEQETEQALRRINDQTGRIVRNGVIGFGCSILVGLGGVIFISRSMVRPLKELKGGLTQLSKDNYGHMVRVPAKDEFGDVAAAFNRMSLQLRADEGIRTDFIASLSHEIRTPLSSVQESVNMISEEVLGPVNEKQKKFLRIAASEISRMTGLLSKLLDASALYAVSSEKQGPVDPECLVRDAVQRLSSVAQKKQISVRVSPLKDKILVRGEEKGLLQAVLNILGNALKFSDPGTCVEIRMRPDAQGRNLKIFIQDQGPGIPEDQQDLIFKKYYRADEVRHHMDGVGLGLNIAKQIAQAHGGRIEVKNNPAEGCTFVVCLPICRRAGAGKGV